MSRYNITKPPTAPLSHPGIIETSCDQHRRVGLSTNVIVWRVRQHVVEEFHLVGVPPFLERQQNSRRGSGDHDQQGWTSHRRRLRSRAASNESVAIRELGPRQANSKRRETPRRRRLSSFVKVPVKPFSFETTKQANRTQLQEKVQERDNDVKLLSIDVRSTKASFSSDSRSNERAFQRNTVPCGACHGR